MEAEIAGITILYRAAETTVGRRKVKHEFPGRDDPFVDDLGRFGYEATLDAFLIGENYHFDRNALEAAFEEPGPHAFVHPYRGPFDVHILNPVRFIERDTEGGVVTFRLDLVRVDDAPESIVTLSESLPTRFADDALDKLKENHGLDTSGAIADVLDSIRGAIEKASTALLKANAKVNSSLSVVNNLAAEIQEFDRQAERLLSTPDQIVAAFQNLALAIMDVARNFTPPTDDDAGEFLSPSYSPHDAVMGALREAFAFVPDPSVVTEATNQATIESAALGAIQVMTQANMLAAGARAMMEIDLPSAAEAVSVQSEIVGMFAEVLNADGVDAEVWESLYALKSAAVRHLQQTQRRLPSTKDHTPTSAIGALRLAWDLYGDASRSSEVVDRNNIRHAAFIQAGNVLEVLAR